MEHLHGLKSDQEISGDHRLTFLHVYSRYQAREGSGDQLRSGVRDTFGFGAPVLLSTNSLKGVRLSPQSHGSMCWPDAPNHTAHHFRQYPLSDALVAKEYH